MPEVPPRRCRQRYRPDALAHCSNDEGHLDLVIWEPAPFWEPAPTLSLSWRRKVLGRLARTVSAAGKEGDMLATDSNESRGSHAGRPAPRRRRHADEPPQAARVGGRRRWSCCACSSLRVFGVIGPKPCTSCHDRDAFRAQTQASPHADVDCRRCHVPAGALGQVVFALQRPLHAYFPQAARCEP